MSSSDGSSTVDERRAVDPDSRVLEFAANRFRKDIRAATTADLARVTECLNQAIGDVAAHGRDLSSRLGANNRAASSKVRQLLRAQW